MFCKKCGEKIPDGSVFCPKCGATLTGAPSGGAAAKTASGGSKKPVVIAVVLCTAVIVAVLLIVFVFNKPKNDSYTPNNAGGYAPNGQTYSANSQTYTPAPAPDPEPQVETYSVTFDVEVLKNINMADYNVDVAIKGHDPFLTVLHGTKDSTTLTLPKGEYTLVFSMAPGFSGFFTKDVKPTEVTVSVRGDSTYSYKLKNHTNYIEIKN